MERAAVGRTALSFAPPGGVLVGEYRVPCGISTFCLIDYMTVFQASIARNYTLFGNISRNTPSNEGHNV
jgi:hypothetical protein